MKQRVPGAHNPEQYLDSSAYIRKLKDAERAHHLDAQGTLEKLTEAAAACQRGGKRHQDKADAYMLAQAAYYAEIKRRTKMSVSERMKWARDVRWRGVMQNYEPIGFRGWCAKAGIPERYGRTLANIGDAPDPKAALYKHRAAAHERRYWIIDGRRAEVKDSEADPFAIFKREFCKFSPAQRVAAWRWINEQFESQLQAAD